MLADKPLDRGLIAARCPADVLDTVADDRDVHLCLGLCIERGNKFEGIEHTCGSSTGPYQVCHIACGKAAHAVDTVYVVVGLFEQRVAASREIQIFYDQSSILVGGRLWLRNVLCEAALA